MGTGLTVAFNEAAFNEDVQKLFDLARVRKEIGDVTALKFPDALKWPAIKITAKEADEAVMAIISAIEVAKAKIMEGLPEGEKFPSEKALKMAVEMADAAIVFDGTFGRILDYFDGKLFDLLVSMKINGLNAANDGDWLDVAKRFIGVV